MTARNVGLLGLGAMGATYHRLLRTDPALASLVDRLRIGARRLPPGWRPLDARDEATTPDAVLDDPSLEAVLIATPPDTHEELAHRALDRGKHVLVEKPAALTAAGARALDQHAATAGRTLQVVSQLRRVDDVQRLRERIRAGELGRIRTALVELPLWRSDAYFAASPARSRHELGNLAYHQLDLAVWCLGPVDRISVVASPAARRGAAARLGAFTAALEHASGCLTTVRYTTEAFPGRAPRLAFDGTAGSIVLESETPVLDLAPSPDDVPDAGLYAREGSAPTAPADWLAPHVAQLRAFLADPRAASPPRLDASSIRTVDLIDRLEQHLRDRTSPL
ncbi:putative oxidoreductase YdgJ [Clavibacter michiganensis]|uniref:Putative oxidoreductase YdgJ n=1 Tax=Clavibacter michiganensis TaxID=28447 RepID=A0A251YER3_9MICO|nr:Gfo/Idh/MocA family oxidoreductase [Clavibacter michiganensis]OUE22599.1 putative oxidoreductase YdgJ [Clavibacter michiganensis]